MAKDREQGRLDYAAQLAEAQSLMEAKIAAGKTRKIPQYRKTHATISAAQIAAVAT